MACAVVALATCGCQTSSYSYRPRVINKAAPRALNALNAQPIATNSTPIRYVEMEKWNPGWWFGNVDSPEPPAWFRPEDPKRRQRWYGRNSLHNFTFYVIGIADKPFVRVGKYPDRVGNPHGGWNWAVCQYKWLRLPFCSYNRGRFNFYAGWRASGNFGLKLNFETPRKKKPASPAQIATEPLSTNGPPASGAGQLNRAAP
jgi:hypothetical protein